MFCMIFGHWPEMRRETIGYSSIFSGNVEYKGIVWRCRRCNHYLGEEI